MSPIKVIITDDEKNAQDVLSNLLGLYCPHVKIVAVCNNVLDTVAAIKKHKPDVIFIDIEMPEYAGYEIVDFFEEIDFQIVFVTAYDQYAIKAFEISALDYLLKPVDINRLKRVVSRVENINKDNLKVQYRNFKETLDTGKINKIVVSFNGERHIVEMSNIIAIEAQESYCCIYLNDGKKFVVSKNLKHFEGLLESNPDFFRTHKSWIVNRKKLISFSKSKFEITMDLSVKAKLSKYKTAEFELFLLK